MKIKFLFLIIFLFFSFTLVSADSFDNHNTNRLSDNLIILEIQSGENTPSRDPAVLIVEWLEEWGFPDVLDWNQAFEDIFVGYEYPLAIEVSNQGNDVLITQVSQIAENCHQ